MENIDSAVNNMSQHWTVKETKRERYDMKLDVKKKLHRDIRGEYYSLQEVMLHHQLQHKMILDRRPAERPWGSWNVEAAVLKYASKNDDI